MVSSRLIEIFQDDVLIEKIKKCLPHLFALAELESSRAGKIGMQVGSLRENIIIALLIYKFGENNVTTTIPITEQEVDVLLFEKSISIKTISDKKLTGVKLIWTVDPHKAREFLENYYPKSDILFIHIVWNGHGGFYYIPLEVQTIVFEKVGRENYIKLPKPGTNPRGVEINRGALEMLVRDVKSFGFDIFWKRPKIDFNAYKRWVEYWEEEYI
jgi:hypothetical protein